MEKLKKYTMIIAIILAIIVLDQVAKLWMINNQNGITILQGILKFDYIESASIAFRIVSGSTLKVIITEILILGILIRFLVRQIENMNMMSKISLALIIGGGLSNFIDKIIRGKVIDYIDISEMINNFPVFNIADVFIILGFIIFAVTVLIDLIKLKPRKLGGN